MIGESVAHYRVLEKLGQGGMGEVFKAEDTKLGRLVALKFLPAEVSSDRLATDRFLREARSASALNHPAICTVYEIGEHNGRPFIAMELLEGKTMAEFIGGRAIEIRLLLDLAIQIADALDAAHAHGILHRDVKPANIFVTRRNQVKILDFGLAKGTQPSADPVPGSGGTTTAARHLSTLPGIAVGTVAYMSPEQARADELDARSDLFSFGVVLYEMATGCQTFAGSSTAVIFEAILNRHPVSPLALNPALPPDLARIIAKALEKDRRLRYQTAGDLEADLHRLRRDLDSSTAVAAAAMTPPPTTPSPAWTMPKPTPTPPGTQSAATPTPSAASKAPQPRSLILLTAISLLIAVAAVMLWLRGGAPAPLPATVAPQAPSQGAATATPAQTPTTSGPATPASAQPAATSPEAVPNPSARVTAPTASAAPAPAARSGDVEGRPAPGGRSSATAARSGDATRRAEAAAARSEAIEGRAAEPGGARGRRSAPAGPSAAELAAQQTLDLARAKIETKLFDQAIADLRPLAADAPTPVLALQAQFLLADALQKQGKLEDAMAVYVEIRDRHASDPRAAEAGFRLGELTLLSRRRGKEEDARRLWDATAQQYPDSPWAPKSLLAKAAVEERMRVRERHPELGVMVPAFVITYQRLVERYPDDPAAELALYKLAEGHLDARRADRAAGALNQLGQRFPNTRYDVWFMLGELYEKRLKDPAKARDAYLRVPPASPRYRLAQRRAEELSRR